MRVMPAALWLLAPTLSASVRVRIVLPLATETDHAIAALDALERWNLAPACAGVTLWPVDVVDSRDDPGAGLQAFFEAHEAGVHAIVGASRSATTLAMARAARHLPLLVVSPRSTSAALSDAAELPYFARTVPSDDVLATAIVAHVERRGWRSIGLAYVNDAFGAGLAVSIERESEARGIALTRSAFEHDEGDEAIGATMGRLTGPDGSPLCVVIIAACGAHVRALADGAAAADVPSTRGQLVLVGPDPTALVREATSEHERRLLNGSVLIEATGDDLSGRFERYVNQTWRALDSRALNKHLPARAHVSASRFGGAHAPPATVLFAADAMETIGRAACASAAPPTDAAALSAAVRTLQFEGLSGRVAFDSSGSRAPGSAAVALLRVQYGEGAHAEVLRVGTFGPAGWVEAAQPKRVAHAFASDAGGALGGAVRRALTADGGAEASAEGEGTTAISGAHLERDGETVFIVLLVAVGVLGAALCCALALLARDRWMHRAALRAKAAEVAASASKSSVPLVIISDAGEDLDDEMALLLAHSLQVEGHIELLGVVANLTPEVERARLVRGTLDVLGMQHVPVGIGTDGGSTSHAAAFLESARYATALHSERMHALEPGRALLHRVLRAAEDKSVTLLCISSLKDAALLLRDNPSLCARKLNRVVVMGGVDVEASSREGYLIPDDAHNNTFDKGAAAYFYRGCVALDISTTIVTRHAAYCAPVPRETYDQLAQSGNPIGWRLRKAQRDLIEDLWRRSCAPPGSAERRGLPDRCTSGWFSTTFCGGRVEAESRHAEDPIWDLVVSFNLYDVVALCAAVPALSSKLFSPTLLPVGGAVVPESARRSSSEESARGGEGGAEPSAESRRTSRRFSQSLRSSLQRRLTVRPATPRLHATHYLIGSSAEQADVRDSEALRAWMQRGIARSVGVEQGRSHRSAREAVMLVLREDARATPEHGTELTLLALRALQEFGALSCATLLVIRQQARQTRARVRPSRELGEGSAGAEGDPAARSELDDGASDIGADADSGRNTARATDVAPSPTLALAASLGIKPSGGALVLTDDDFDSGAGGSIAELIQAFNRTQAGGVRLVLPSGCPRLLERLARTWPKLFREKIAEVVGLVEAGADAPLNMRQSRVTPVDTPTAASRARPTRLAKEPSHTQMHMSADHADVVKRLRAFYATLPTSPLRKSRRSTRSVPGELRSPRRASRFLEDVTTARVSCASSSGLQSMSTFTTQTFGGSLPSLQTSDSPRQTTDSAPHSAREARASRQARWGVGETQARTAPRAPERPLTLADEVEQDAQGSRVGSMNARQTAWTPPGASARPSGLRGTRAGAGGRLSGGGMRMSGRISGYGFGSALPRISSAGGSAQWTDASVEARNMLRASRFSRASGRASRVSNDTATTSLPTVTSPENIAARELGHVSEIVQPTIVEGGSTGELRAEGGSAADALPEGLPDVRIVHTPTVTNTPAETPPLSPLSGAELPARAPPPPNGVSAQLTEAALRHYQQGPRPVLPGREAQMLRIVPAPPTAYPAHHGSQIARQCYHLGVPVLATPGALVRACALPRSVVDALSQLSGDFGRQLHESVRAPIEACVRAASGADERRHESLVAVSRGWVEEEYGTSQRPEPPPPGEVAETARSFSHVRSGRWTSQRNSRRNSDGQERLGVGSFMRRQSDGRCVEAPPPVGKIDEGDEAQEDEGGAARTAHSQAWASVRAVPAYGPVCLLAVAQRSCGRLFFQQQRVAKVRGTVHFRLGPEPMIDSSDVVAVLAHLCLKGATLNAHALTAEAPPPTATGAFASGIDCAGVGWVPLADTVPVWLSAVAPGRRSSVISLAGTY